jgi:hypothetical protein
LSVFGKCPIFPYFSGFLGEKWKILPYFVRFLGKIEVFPSFDVKILP